MSNKTTGVNHNPNNVQIGEYCILDNNTQYPVKIFSMTENKIFSEVGNHAEPIDTWTVMTRRLKRIKQ